MQNLHYDYDMLAPGIASIGYDVVTHDSRGKGTRIGTYASYRQAQAHAVLANGTVYGPTN